MRQTLVDLVTTALSHITTANGYLTNAGSTVTEWAFLNESNPQPTLQVRDVSCSPQSGMRLVNAQNAWYKRLELKIIYIASETIGTPGLAPATLRQLLCDCVRAIGLIDFPDSVTNVTWGGDDMGGVQESKKYIGLSLSMLIDYTTDPFTD
jgi:hypothetical protein